MIRLRVSVYGLVQGVGFRPFVFRLAEDLGLKGWVSNSNQGAVAEVEGDQASVDRFLIQLRVAPPPRASIQGLEPLYLDPFGYGKFEIRESTSQGETTALVQADIATCPDCLAEIRDPQNRRFNYAFTNCTNCGPRYSIILGLPYDREATTMRGFEMCPQCRAEYENPLDRRFHAQPIACPACGPGLELWDRHHKVFAGPEGALDWAADLIREGAILALKGLGGFQLLADAGKRESVTRLRQRKNREEKPFALMAPDLKTVRTECEVSDLEARLLESPEAPIVLLDRIQNHKSKIQISVAPGNPCLGFMLPYTPLHHLLMAKLSFPVVATSGNLSDEPICLDENEAMERLKGIADYYLVHNRPIARQVDDSVARVLLGREQVLRRARGYAPLPVAAASGAEEILAVGGHLKNAVALAKAGRIFVSQHIGDLDTEPAFEAFKNVAKDLQNLLDAHPSKVACDLHPDYASTRWARQSGLPLVEVQHHHAHALSCMAENEIKGPVLGVTFDGSGFGPDFTVWGGEFLKIEGGSYTRLAHLRTFKLPGGEAAVKEPRRAALGVLYEIVGAKAYSRGSPLALSFTNQELETFGGMLENNVNCPLTSSAGRLFDAVACLLDLKDKMAFEGQAAMELEYLARSVFTEKSLFLHLDQETFPWILDWQPMLIALMNEKFAGADPALLAAKFHNGLVQGIAQVARAAGLEKVCLSGGCFLNRILTERTVGALQGEGFKVYWHQRVPPGDGGIALGQIVAAM